VEEHRHDSLRLWVRTAWPQKNRSVHLAVDRSHSLGQQ
jgi:hypothetical protein